MIVGKHVVFGAHDGRVYVVTLADGEDVQTLDLGSPVAASPAVADGWVFIGTEGGTFHALGLKPAPANDAAKKKGRGA